jgi:hypothetical protein
MEIAVDNFDRTHSSFSIFQIPPHVGDRKHLEHKG